MIKFLKNVLKELPAILYCSMIAMALIAKDYRSVFAFIVGWIVVKLIAPTIHYFIERNTRK